MGDSSTNIEPGTVLADKYRVDEVLGEGGMGVVVKATHLLLDEPVALKFLLPELAKRPDASARFLREAKAAMRIRGEHVAQVLDVGRLDGGEPYIVMEYLDGRDLDEELERRGVLPVTEAVDAVLQACRALHGAHAAGVVHRDIKPANLFLTRTPDGQPLVKVLDFGISKLSGDRVDALTKTSTTMGSALYMSPEQLKSAKDVDHRTDIYALGVTLYQLLTDDFPFMAETMPQLVAAVLTDPPAPLSERRPGIPPALEEAVARAMARDRDDRHQTVSDLARALAPFGTLAGRMSLASIDPTVPTKAYGSPHDGRGSQPGAHAGDLAYGDTRLPHSGEGPRPTVPRGPETSAPATVASPGAQAPSPMPSGPGRSGGYAPVTVISGQLPAGFEATGPPTSQTIDRPKAKRHTPVLLAVGAAIALLAIAIPMAVLSSDDDAPPTASPADEVTGAASQPPEEPHRDPVEDADAAHDDDDLADEAAGGADSTDTANDDGAAQKPSPSAMPRPTPHVEPTAASSSKPPTPAPPKPRPKPKGSDIFDAHK